MKKQNVKFRWLSTLATCLILALCIGISIPLAGCDITEAEAGTVTMEINPGVEYVITRDGNVKAVRFLNDGAEELLEEIALKGQSLKSALSLTVAAYKTAGFMESNDTVLISFDKKLIGDAKLKESVSSTFSPYSMLWCLYQSQTLPLEAYHGASIHFHEYICGFPLRSRNSYRYNSQSFRQKNPSLNPKS